MFHRQGTLFAQAFDAKKLVFTGQPNHVADDLVADSNGRGEFDVSQNGVLLYVQGGRGAGPSGRGRTAGYQLGWLERTGRAAGYVGDLGPYGDFDLSPEGTRVATTKQDTGASGADIWTWDIKTGVPARLTRDPADDVDPVWSWPTGDRIAFTTYRKGNADIYVKNANGVGDDMPLVASAAN